MNKLLQSILNWYFSKRAIPYWTVLVIDIIICYLSGIFVFWLYYHGAVNTGEYSHTDENNLRLYDFQPYRF